LILLKTTRSGLKSYHYRNGEALKGIIKTNNEKRNNRSDSPNNWLPAIALLYITYKEKQLNAKSICDNKDD
jgi:hypothetical protein